MSTSTRFESRLRRLPEALQLGSAHRHVETYRVGADVFERLFLRDLVAALADHERELHLVVVAPLGPAQLDLLAEADKRGIRLEEQAPLADALLDVGAAVRDAGIPDRFGDVIAVVDRRPD